MGLPIYAQLDDGVCKKSIEVSDEQLVGVNIAGHGEWNLAVPPAVAES